MLPGWSLAVSALACGLLSITPSRLADAYKVEVNASTTTHAKWDGWGTSLSWFANYYGMRVDIANAIFTLKRNVTLSESAKGLPGLGFNIARYTIGGSNKHVIDNAGVEVTMKQSDAMFAHRLIEGYWLDWMNADPASPSWNWTADSNQRDMLALAIERGANVLEAFANSPPWWMNKNLATACGDQGNVDNLTPHNHEQYALYLATVLKKFKTDWNVTFHYIEPYNEPSALWWEFPCKQEGCFFSVDTQIAILPLLRKQLDAFDLQDIAITVSDENSPEDALHTLEAMEKTPGIVDTFTKVNTHGYFGLEAYRGDKRGALKDLVKKLKKELWDSELNENDGSGLTMAESICLDINEMGAVGVVYWQILDVGGWGFVECDLANNYMGKVNPKYFVMAQFSRHIRPGMKILASSDMMTVVGFDAKKNLLVLVTVNVGESHKFEYDLASFKAVASPVKAWTTETSGEGALYKMSTLRITGTLLRSTLPAKSVKTFEITVKPNSVKTSKNATVKPKSVNTPTATVKPKSVYTPTATVQPKA